ncbi:hypothetical protein RUM44_003139 [Polyplax serrata]|uniref:G-patch domain-containing protein n=1 Tax=Polyplax serrata TaxID=468196 RepID=A0ABR1AYA9_POLSC
MSSSDTEDEFVKYGTPLEPLEEDEIPKKRPILLEDQTVKDKQGRRRFHGAFTGGFSAGFFNSVGSLQGWRPSSFKSSKSEKNIPVHQKPEDYMDEEDTGEFGIAPIILRTKEAYAYANEKPLHNQSTNTHFGAYVLHNILKPARQTIGLKLLMIMGWKPGQGVGPREKRTEKKNISRLRQKVYGCKLPSAPSDGEESGSDSELKDVTFAPDDYEPYLHLPKSNFFGIGYEGLQKNIIPGSIAHTSLQHKFILEKSKKKFNIQGQAFGVGAFEDEDDDIYSRDDLNQYDFSLATESNKEDKNTRLPVKIDGILEGFIPQVKKHIKKQYQLPIIPKNFKGLHKIKTSRFNNVEEELNLLKRKIMTKEPDEFIHKLKKPLLDDSRAAEEAVCVPFKGPSTKTFNFRPFCFDPAKQERFETYLKLLDEGKKDALESLQPLNMTDWAKEAEKLEFDQASKLLKPLTGTLSNRFRTASKTEDLSDPLATVEKYNDDNDDCVKAAKMKMYGPLTRSQHEWLPCPLLSKRFNIPELKAGFNPSVESKHKGTAKELLFTSEFISSFTVSAKQTDNVYEKNIHPETKEKQINTVEESSKMEVQDIPKDYKLGTRFLLTTENKIDLFRAIFLDSDDENEYKDVEKDKIQEEEIQYEEKVINSKRNTSPPKGIFENIDLTTFEDWRKKKNETVALPLKPVEKQKTPLKDDLLAEGVYGPKIPEKIEVHHKNCESSSYLQENFSVDDARWVEKNLRNKKHKKKEKKSKKSKHKSKHKMKRKSER